MGYKGVIQEMDVMDRKLMEKTYAKSNSAEPRPVDFGFTRQEYVDYRREQGDVMSIKTAANRLEILVKQGFLESKKMLCDGHIAVVYFEPLE